MKRFLKHITILFLIIVGLMVVLDKAYSYVFKHSEPRSKIQKILQLSDKHYEYVFLGSSRTENHIDCEIITKITGKSCVNFGISGGSIGDMYILLKLMDANNLSFDKVFLQLDYNYNSTGLSSNFKARLMPFINEPVINNELRAVGISNAEKNIPFYRFMENDKVIGFREFVSSMVNKNPKKDFNIGFAPKIGVGNFVSTSFPQFINESNDEVMAIERLVKAKGKTIQFFTSPYCSEVKNRERAMRDLKERVYSLWDYSNLYDNRPEYFFNCGHLNIEGAQHFTKLLVEKL